MRDTEESKGTRAWAYRLAVFFAVVTYGLLWVWQGVDMTDEGFHLSQQQMSARGAIAAPLGMLWLTYRAGGLWLMLTDGLGLLGARLGWALTIGGTAWVAFRVLACYFPLRAAALAAAVTAPVLLHHGNMVINQNNLPFLLLAVAAAFLLAADRAQLARRRAMCALGGGAVLGLAIFARFPLVVSFMMVIVPGLTRSIQQRKVSAFTWRLTGCALAGALLAIAGGLSVLAAEGRLSIYVASLSGSGFKEEYSLHALLRTYIDSGWHMVRGTFDVLVEAVPWAVGLHVLCRLASCGRAAPWVLFAVAWVWIQSSIARVGFGAFHWEYFHVLPGLCLLAAGIVFATAWWRGARDEETTRQQVLVVMAAALAVFIMAGTNNGVLNMTHGLWLLVPVCLLLLPGALVGPAGTPAARTYVRVVAAVLILLGAGIRFFNTYRDARARWQMVAQVPSLQLRGIRTTPERAASLGAMLSQLDRRLRPGDVLLTCDDTPLVHFLTRTVPALGNPWPETLGLAELRLRSDQMLQVGPRPAAVVRARSEMGSGDWGRHPAGRRTLSGSARDRAEALNDAVRRLGYSEVWTNADFAILAPPPGGGVPVGGGRAQRSAKE